MTYSITFLDESGEKSTVGFHLPDITGANFENFLGDTGLGNEQLLLDAVQAFSGGAMVVTNGTIQTDRSPVQPVDPTVQNEIKVAFTYRDSTNGKIGRFEIPAYNYVAKIPGSDQVDMTSTEVSDLQTALNNYIGFDGGTINLISGKLVGRNI